MAKPAVVIVDMIKDNVPSGSPFRGIIPNLQRLLSEARKAGCPIIFANDSFLPNDFIFREGMKPFALRGTEGVKVIPELQPQEKDIVLEKRRFSAFFKTDLDITLRMFGIDTIALGGIAIELCILYTAFDGMANDFKVIILEDCCASHGEAFGKVLLDLYRTSRLQHFIRIMTLNQFCSEVLSK